MTENADEQIIYEAILQAFECNYIIQDNTRERSDQFLFRIPLVQGLLVSIIICGMQSTRPTVFR
jgi:hypothetical protein